MPKLSVIIPIYNNEKYLRKCLDSLCNQTLKDIEIICVNDCSPDNSLEILQNYAAKDSRIKIINFEENKGVSAARNKGINVAQGEYIGFVDSDDFVDLDFYEKLYNKAKETGAEAVKGNIKYLSKNTNSERIIFYDINQDVKNNIAYFYHSFTSAIYKSKFLKKNQIKFPEGINNFEDPYFSIKAAIAYKKVSILDDAFYYYCDRANSVSNQKDENKIIQMFSSIKEIFLLLNSSNISKTHYIIVYDFILKILQIYLYNKDLTIKINQNAISLFNFMTENCKYKEDSIQFYFFAQKKFENKNRFHELRQKVKRG